MGHPDADLHVSLVYHHEIDDFNHVFSHPGLSWSAVLLILHKGPFPKKTGEKQVFFWQKNGQKKGEINTF